MILAIETSGALCSVAYWEDGKTLIEYNVEIAMQHAELLAKLVDDGLTFLSRKPLKKHYQLKDIKLVAVGVGPGSFTGLRIGLSYAQGFCFARRLPIVGISSHQVLASQHLRKYPTFYTLVEARRNEVYLAEIHVAGDMYPEMINHQIVDRNDLNAVIPEGAHILYKHGMTLDEDIIEGLHSRDVVIYDQGRYSASIIAQLGYQKWKTKQGDDLAQIEPMYIRPFAGVL